MFHRMVVDKEDRGLATLYSVRVGNALFPGSVVMETGFTAGSFTAIYIGENRQVKPCLHLPPHAFL